MVGFAGTNMVRNRRELRREGTECAKAKKHKPSKSSLG
jgi:hypothetical protein